jgi:hypothetical protein
LAQLTWSFTRLIARTHAMCAFTLMLLVTFVMAGQVARRHTFASTELYEDVMDRWGAPIVQGAPSVRYAEHGSVFHKLEALPLSQQLVAVDAQMNYRKRGLVYFSGFDFEFRGDYAFVNPRDVPIDVAFVFPLSMQRDQVLLSDLSFVVDGQAEAEPLAGGDDKLLWTGRVEPGQRVEVAIRYRGRGLDSFLYALDPALPVRGLDLTLDIAGGDNHDYPPGVVPATELRSRHTGTQLRWQYDALEAGVPMGAILPSETGFDQVLHDMITRAWAPFTLFFLGLVVLGLVHGQALRLYQMMLIVSAYLFFYVLVAYLAAFLNFYVAWILSLAITAGLVVAYLRRVIDPLVGPQVLLLLGATLLTPTAAVLLRGYTGLVYTFEILGLLAALMAATTRPQFSLILDELRRLAAPQEAP